MRSDPRDIALARQMMANAGVILHGHHSHGRLPDVNHDPPHGRGDNWYPPNAGPNRLGPGAGPFRAGPGAASFGAEMPSSNRPGVAFGARVPMTHSPGVSFQPTGMLREVHPYGWGHREDSAVGARVPPSHVPGMSTQPTGMLREVHPYGWGMREDSAVGGSYSPPLLLMGLPTDRRAGFVPPPGLAGSSQRWRAVQNMHARADAYRAAHAPPSVGGKATPAQIAELRQMMIAALHGGLTSVRAPGQPPTWGDLMKAGRTPPKLATLFHPLTASIRQGLVMSSQRQQQEAAQAKLDAAAQASEIAAAQMARGWGGQDPRVDLIRKHSAWGGGPGPAPSYGSGPGGGDGGDPSLSFDANVNVNLPPPPSASASAKFNL
jgi:hypothetical protein